jgi:nicotinamide-nucleotide adenylyltransferase
MTLDGAGASRGGSASLPAQRGLFVGRFQPFHLGHLDAVRRLARQDDELIVGIGSANVSHTPANPFTAGERAEMALAALREAGVGNALVVPLPDIGRNALWVSHVASLVPRFTIVHTNNPLPARLFAERGYEVAGVPFHERERFEGTSIRAAMARGDEAAWRAAVPPAVARVIVEVDGPARVRDLARERFIVEGADADLA